MVNHSYCSPKLSINGITYNTLKDFNLSFPGNNQINKVSFTLATAEIKEQALYGKPIELFLNYGSEDGLPIFRGIIRDINPSETQTKFTALDARSLLSGNNTTPLNITDKQNYDGYTLGQFLQKIIQDDYMEYTYNHDLASALSSDLTHTVGAGDGVQADATQAGSDALFESSSASSPSGNAVLPVYGQSVTLNDGYSTKTFEFTNDPIANAVITGNIAVQIDNTAGDQGIKNTMDNLMNAIETNLHIDCIWSGDSVGGTPPFVARIDGTQRIAGSIGNTTVSQSKTANAQSGDPLPFLDSGQRENINNFSGGNTGTTTYSGTFTNVPARKGTVKVEVDDRDSNQRFIVKGTDTRFETFGDGNAETTTYHATTDTSPETKVVSGSIDYDLGTYSITFANPIWSGKSIRLSFNQPSKENKISLLGTELLNDTDPAVSLTGYRNKKISPYQVVLDKLKEAIDTTDVEKPKEWFVQVKEDDRKSNIVFVKRKSKDTSPSTVFNYRDGISSVSYKQRLSPNTAIASGKEGGRQVFAYSNRPRGIVSKDVEITKEYPAEAYKEAIIDIFKGIDEVNDISVKINKLPYIGLESIIDLNIEDDEISGKAVVVSKDIKWSKSKMSINLKLDRRPVKVSDFIQ